MHHSKPDKDEYIFNIIKALQLNPIEFEQNRIDGAAYETILYNWAVNLYQEGKSCDEAFRIILEKRVQILYSINGNIMLEDTMVTDRKYQKVLTKLQTISAYDDLKEKEKQSIRRKAIALIETRLWSISEVVEFIVKIIKNSIKTEEEQKKYKTTIIDKNQSKDNSSEFFLEFKNLLISKTNLNETILRSS
ncbi:hypothetical protein [Aquimarina latercula]|uniref:hypothetical protein n=1 Tax=Aquimarina latercula TaxID=987 RepID=UPI00040E11F2|nr:hypothetical protein [Aquimarina latercula]